MASENRDWGYDRIAGALANLGYEISDQTVGNVLQRHALPPAPERKRTTTWPVFIRTHLALLAATDFFTAEVLTLRGLVTYYVLFFIHLESRWVDIAGITVHPDQPWMKQIARNATMEGCGALRDCRYLLHDRDTKYTQSFRGIIASGQIEPLTLPAHSPNLNAYAERWVRSVKEECLSKVILFGERSLRRALSEYVEHFHAERNHQGKGNVLLFPHDTDLSRDGPVRCRERLGGLLCYYPSRGSVIRRQGFAMKWNLPIRPIQSGPLTDREVEDLNAFLLAEDSLENAMDVSTFDGFICAVLSVPNTIVPDTLH